MRVVLRPISESAARAVLAGRVPPGLRLAGDYPTEFSAEVAESVGGDDALGPFFMHRCEDDVVVGEIGGTFVGPGTIEIGYAVVRSCWGRGYAADGVLALVSRARELDEIHAPVDRPASGRVLRKAGFTLVGESDQTHDGVAMRVQRWELGA